MTPRASNLTGVEIYSLVEMKWKERSGTAKTATMAKRCGGWGNDATRMVAGEQERQASQVLGEGARRHPGLDPDLRLRGGEDVVQEDCRRRRRHRRDAGSSGLPRLTATAKPTSSPPSRASAGCACGSSSAAAVARCSSSSASTESRPPPPPCSPCCRRRLPSHPSAGAAVLPVALERRREREKRKGEKRGKKDEADLDRLTLGPTWVPR
uniref:Uncharacterized protein n=1 Tax=Oryza glumipatula TaxID=40148 RepID=A0A0E0B5H3_9ORYZ